jgi:hypothetical protein
MTQAEQGLYPTITASEWIADQLAQQRELVLVIDRLAEPDPVQALFNADLMQDYVNLYQGTEFADMAEVGPWLVRLYNPDAELVQTLLDTPEDNWGWLASAADIDLTIFAQHWRERILIDEEEQPALYRFQDNRVIARSLAHLTSQQLPQLLGPLSSILYWDGGAWRSQDNPAPGSEPFSKPAPWLYPEPQHIARQIRLDNLKQWLWETQPDATTALAKHHNIRHWLNERLDLAERWGWAAAEQVLLVLNTKRGALDAHPAWEALPGEAAENHFLRCQSVFTSLDNKSTPT